jgi:hypothetical protein
MGLPWKGYQTVSPLPHVVLLLLLLWLLLASASLVLLHLSMSH